MKLPKQLLTGILFTAFILSLISSSANCQIKIKETVNINPQKLAFKKILSNIDIEEYLKDSDYLPPIGAFPDLFVIRNWMYDDGTPENVFDAVYTENLWFDFCAFHDYNRIKIVEGSEYARIKVGNYTANYYCYTCSQSSFRTGYSDVINNTTSFTDAGDNFTTNDTQDGKYTPFWISFDKNSPPTGEAIIRIQMIHDHKGGEDWSPYPDSVEYMFILEGPRIYASAYPENILKFQKNDITFYPIYYLSDQSTLDAKIIHGSEYGDLLETSTNATGKEIQNIQNNSNHILFIPQSISNTIEDSVVILFSSANPIIAPTKVVLKIESEKLQVTFVPSVVSAGEVANIIVKKKNDNGSLEDFPSDQLFNVRIVDGEDYGSILVPGYRDSTTQRWYVPQGFSFCAKKQIPLTSVQASVYVEATQGGAESIKPDKPLLNKKQSTIHKTIISQSILQKNSSLKSNLVINPNISYKSSATKSVKQVSSVNSTQDDETIFGTGTVTINSEGLMVSFDRPTFSPGDTLNVIIKKVDAYGNEINYPDTTQFEVGIQSGCSLGVILNTAKDTTAQYFAKIRQPIKLIASTPSNSDSVIVLIVGAPDIVENQNQAKVSQVKSGTMLKINANNSNITSLQTVKKIKKTAGPGQECLFFQMLHSLFGTTSATVNKQHKLEIIYPLATSANEIITSEPKMPTVICKAKLHNYSGDEIFHWEYWVSSNINRTDVDKSKLCTRICQTKITGKSTSKDSTVTQWIVPFSVTKVKWFLLKATVPERNKIKHKFYNGDCNSEVNKWQDAGNDVFTGGNVFVKVTAYSATDTTLILAVDTLSANQILGIDNNKKPTNPDQTTILNSAPSKAMKAIMTVESGRIQFNKYGYPYFGPPNGFGLMQIDNYYDNNIKMHVGPSEMEMWNWKRNFNRGHDIFTSDSIQALKYLKVYDNYSQDQVMLEAFHEYNFGGNDNYWIWNKQKNIWEEQYLGEKDYADKVMENYK